MKLEAAQRLKAARLSSDTAHAALTTLAKTLQEAAAKASISTSKGPGWTFLWSSGSVATANFKKKAASVIDNALHHRGFRTSGMQPKDRRLQDWHKDIPAGDFSDFPVTVHVVLSVPRKISGKLEVEISVQEDFSDAINKRTRKESDANEKWLRSIGMWHLP